MLKQVKQARGMAAALMVKLVLLSVLSAPAKAMTVYNLNYVFSPQAGVARAAKEQRTAGAGEHQGAFVHQQGAQRGLRLLRLRMDRAGCRHSEEGGLERRPQRAPLRAPRTDA